MPRAYSPAIPTQSQRLPAYTRDEAWIRAFLQRAEVGHLAHSHAEQPFVTSINFWFDAPGNRILFHGNNHGRLRSNLEHNPRICLEVSEVGRMLPANTALEFSTQYRSVMVFGRVEILVDDEQRRAALYALIHKYFPSLTPGKEFRPITDQELAHTTVYALQIESWSGKENWAEQAEQLPVWPPLPDDLLK